MLFNSTLAAISVRNHVQLQGRFQNDFYFSIFRHVEVFHALLAAHTQEAYDM